MAGTNGPTFGRVYPRGCGGTYRSVRVFGVVDGLSPRVRGNPHLIRQRWCRRSVYPRGCGGTPAINPFPCRRCGLSPRVRGNRRQGCIRRLWIGSIPAGAGEPHLLRRQNCVIQVYPRGCGGTNPRGCGGTLDSILRLVYRSIPAGAGEPNLVTLVPGASAVYPRGCGGTSLGGRGGYPKNPVYPRGCGGTELGQILSPETHGLSPRVRGNQPGTTGNEGSDRSIPAGAGEPTRRRSRTNRCPVYPRGCGGTPPHSIHVRSIYGLSPRVRGNPDQLVRPSYQRRSIPAGAGEPLAFGVWRKCPTVYPRGCGGTRSSGSMSA